MPTKSRIEAKKDKREIRKSETYHVSLAPLRALMQCGEGKWKRKWKHGKLALRHRKARDWTLIVTRTAACSIVTNNNFRLPWAESPFQLRALSLRSPNQFSARFIKFSRAGGHLITWKFLRNFNDYITTLKGDFVYATLSGSVVRSLTNSSFRGIPGNSRIIAPAESHAADFGVLFDLVQCSYVRTFSQSLRWMTVR